MYEGRMKLGICFCCAALLAVPAAAHNKGDGTDPPIDYANAEEHEFGKASDPKTATRSIEVSMSDAMRFEPAVIRARRGERLRLQVSNEGKLVHEMVLGTREELDQHAELMRRFPGMEHEEPYMVHVDPDHSGVIGWTFTRAGEYFYGCLIPGHFEAGMMGRIVVE